MKKNLILCMALALTLGLSTNVQALEVPTDTVVQNLNGSQQVVKTYTVGVAVDPQELIEDPFELDGYLYTFANIVKTENQVDKVKQHTQAVTVETAKKDLSAVLEALAPVLEYDDGTYSGRLALDHTSIHTEAAGYTSRSYTVTETKEIGQLDRNDMSYVPATTTKNGVTLSLAGVDWQVQSTAMVDDVLVPSQYKAVATYTGTGQYSAATGYVTTAEYVGEVSHTGVESVTYTLTYLGDDLETEASHSGAASWLQIAGKVFSSRLFLMAVCLAETVAVIVLAVLLARTRREMGDLRSRIVFEQEEDGAPDFEKEDED